MKRFVIIGAARSGTTLTHSVLRGHPEVSMFREEIRIRELFGSGVGLFTFQDLKNAEQRRKGMRRLFDVFALEDDSAEVKAAGIKCAFGSRQASQLFVEGIKDHFPDMSIILVRRDDLVAQYGSVMRARKTGRYHSWARSKRAGKGDSAALKLSKGLFRHYVLEVRDSLDVIRSLGGTHPFLEVSYEEDLCSNPTWHQQLYRFLELSEVEPTWVQNKKVSPPPQEYISNYDQLKAIQKEVLRNGVAQFSLKRSLNDAVKGLLHGAADWARKYP